MASDEAPASAAGAADGAPPRRSMRPVIAASLSGAALEWYDFNLYGLSAALVLNKIFFPDVSPVIGTLASLATFGVGFVLRPDFRTGVGPVLTCHVNGTAVTVCTCTRSAGVTWHQVRGRVPSCACVRRQEPGPELALPANISVDNNQGRGRQLLGRHSCHLGRPRPGPCLERARRRSPGRRPRVRRVLGRDGHPDVRLDGRDAHTSRSGTPRDLPRNSHDHHIGSLLVVLRPKTPETAECFAAARDGRQRSMLVKPIG
ncbi:hypothetical protein [Streptomyces sp. NPDC054786]